MEEEIRTFELNHGFVRVQKVILDSFDQLQILRPSFSFQAYERLVDLYENFIIQKYGTFFGQIILFYLPEDMEIPFSFYDENYGEIFDPLIAVSIAFEKKIKVHKKQIVIEDNTVRSFYEQLLSRNCLHVVSGKRNTLSLMPIGRSLGFLSQTERDASFRVNSSFFVMDVFDRKTVYDQIGTAFGLNLKDGKILLPPLFDREAFLLNDKNHVTIKPVSLKQIKVIVDNTVYEHGKNALFLSRPQYKYVAGRGTNLLIIEDRVVAIKKGGKTPVPSGGFILHLEDENITVHDLKVRYAGLENYKFGIQVGNSVMIDGRMTEHFISPFFHLSRPWVPAYPPSMYPLNFRKSKAPRIVLGTDDSLRPMILWFEGAGKHGHDSSKESSGVSLSEAGRICKELGIKNAIHLDGGGSAQILLNGKRSLKVSDRDPDTFAEKERPVAIGLYVK